MPVSEITNQNTSSPSLPYAFTNDVLDFEVLRTFEKIKSDNGSDILIELIDLFLQGTSQRIIAMRKAADGKEWTVLNRAAHTLKGSSSTLGLRQIAKTCQVLEEASSSSTDDVSTLINLLASGFLEAGPLLVAERNKRLLLPP